MTEKKSRKRPRAKGTGRIYKPAGSRFYWIAYTAKGGKRYYESSTSERKETAIDLLNQRLGDLGRGLLVTAKINKIDVGEALKAVVDDQTMNGRRSADRTQGRIDDHLLVFFKPERPLITITTADLERYQSHRLIEQKAERATVNREMAIVRRAFRLAMRGGKITSMPHIPMLQEDNARQGFLEPDQLVAILAHLPAYLHPPLRSMYATGWRKSEVFSLTVGQVDLKAGIVRLEPGTTKSGKGRTIFVTEALRTILATQLASVEALKKAGLITPYVFHRPDGTQIKAFRKLWETARVSAGYPNALLHDFRRSAVRNLERAGVPRSAAMAMVGHETESIYLRYAIVDEAVLREAAAKQDAWTAGQAETGAKGKRKGQLRRFGAG